MNHDRITGSLREDLEAADRSMRLSKKDANFYGDKGYLWHYEPHATCWNLWPEALQAYIRYQQQSLWHEGFIKGVVE